MSGAASDHHTVVVNGPDTGGSEPAPGPAVGESLGRYRIDARVGEGGGGLVMRGFDPELQRPVALKLLRARPDKGEGRNAMERLAREARALARLTHPNIVEVYDVGVEDGALWIAMELVDGRDLGAWLRDGEHSTASVLQIFMQAGRGLAAAHEAGIVHRDFKPGNVLVGSDGRARVADFGLARAAGISTPSSESEPMEAFSSDPSFSGPILGDAITRTGLVLGTPGYMAPELFHDDVTRPAADQFAFCASLYRGLYGKLPWARGIPDAPVRFPDGASHRVPRWLRAVLQRGLALEPDRRYPSMDALLAALAHRPRRSWSVAGVAVAACVLGVAFAGGEPAGSPGIDCDAGTRRWAEVLTTERVETIRAAATTTALPFATPTVERALGGLAGFGETWAATHREVCVAARDGMTEQAVADRQLACLDSAMRRATRMVEMLEHADAAIVENAAAVVDGLPEPAACVSVTEVLVPDDSPEAREILEALDEAEALAIAGKREHALQLARSAVARAETASRPDLRARALIRVGAIEHQRYHAQAAYDALSEGAWAASTARDDTAMVEAARHLIAVLGPNGLGRLDEALTWAERAESALERLGNDRVQRMELDRALARLAVDRGEYAAALELAEAAVSASEELYAPDDPRSAKALLTLAKVQDAMGRDDRQLPLVRRAFAVQQAAFGDTHPSVLHSQIRIAFLLTRLGDVEEGAKVAEQVHRLVDEHLPLDHPVRHDIAEIRSMILAFRSEFAAAAEALDDQIERCEDDRGAEHPTCLTSRLNRAKVIYHLGEHERAHQEIGEVAERLAEVLPANHPIFAKLKGSMAWFSTRQGDLEQAIEQYRETERVLLASLGPDHPDLSQVYLSLGVLLYRSDQPAESVQYYEKMDALNRASYAPDHPSVIATAPNVAWPLMDLGRVEEACERFEYARRVQSDAFGEHDYRLSYTFTGLGECLHALGRYDDAVVAFENALRAGAELPEKALFRDDTRYKLGLTLWARDRPGDRRRARREITRAHELFIEKGESVGAQECADWLAEHGASP